MNIYQETEEGAIAVDLDAAAAELKATSLIQNDGVRRARMAEISAAALLDIASSLRVLAGEAAAAMLPAASVEHFTGEVELFTPGGESDGPRDFLLEGDLVHKIDDDEPGEVVALGFDGDGALYADVEFGAGPVRLYASSLVRLVGDEDGGEISDEEEAADPDLVDLDAGTIAPADLVDDIDADFGDESHPAAESAVDVLRANEAAHKAAKKKGSKK